MRWCVATVTIAVVALTVIVGCGDDSMVQSATDCPAADQDIASEPNWRDFADYRTWTRDGCVVRIDVLADRPGPDHCDFGSVRVIITGEPLGASYTNDGDDVEYIRDPLNRMGFRDGLDENATLPANAEFTGYRSVREELWIDPTDADAIFIVNGSSVERWPRGEAPLCS